MSKYPNFSNFLSGNELYDIFLKTNNARRSNLTPKRVKIKTNTKINIIRKCILKSSPHISYYHVLVSLGFENIPAEFSVRVNEFS